MCADRMLSLLNRLDLGRLCLLLALGRTLPDLVLHLPKVSGLGSSLSATVTAKHGELCYLVALAAARSHRTPPSPISSHPSPRPPFWSYRSSQVGRFYIYTFPQKERSLLCSGHTVPSHSRYVNRLPVLSCKYVYVTLMPLPAERNSLRLKSLERETMSLCVSAHEISWTSQSYMLLHRP